MTTGTAPTSSSGLQAFLRSRVGALIQVVLITGTTFVLRPSSIWFPVLIAGVAAVLIWLAGDTWSDLGFARPKERAARWVIEGAVTGLLWQFIAIGILVPALNGVLNFPAAVSRQGDLPYYLLLMLYGIMQAFAKGLAYRAFLLHRLETILGRTSAGLALSLLLASSLFGLSSWHQGLASIIVVGLAGAVFNLLFFWSRRNIWPTILAHVVYNAALSTLVYFGRA